MRVLFLTTWYPNAENPIAGTYVHEQAVALRQAGVDIRIVQPLPLAPFPISRLNDSYRKLAAIPSQNAYQGFAVHHPRYLLLPADVFFEWAGDWMYRALGRTVAALYAQWPFDLIHAHTTYPCGYVANRLRNGWFPDVKVIHTIHRTCIIDTPHINRRCFTKVRTALEGADYNVFVSLEGMRLGLEYTEARIAHKSTYITNGVNVAQFQLTPQDQAEVDVLKAHYKATWNLVFVGYIMERKGIKELLTAMQQLVAAGYRQCRLFLVGANRMGSYVHDFIAANSLQDYIVPIGPVLHDRVKIWMHFADAVILPSYSEGMPTVLFEALYTGTPSIFTTVGGVGDIVKDGEEALLIPPQSVDAIKQAIVRLLNNPRLGQHLALKGHQLIRDHYTWEMNAAKHMQLYEKVTAGGGRVPALSPWHSAP
jgi:teichuronic acid biosynthesis glycosyltransferase TuaC